MTTLSLKDLSVRGKKVLVRVDFNVPQDSQGNITDDTRITAALPTIKYLLDHGAAVILMSHLGRPDGKKNPKYSLLPCAKLLSTLLKQDVALIPDCVGSATETTIKALKPGQVVLLENLRFHPGEEHPDKEPGFVESLAKLGDLYVNDAFGTAHRAHASVVGVPKLFPGKSAPGFLMENEINHLQNMLSNPKRPFCAIIGGSKISTKCAMIEALLKKADEVLIGGGMTYTFMKAQGLNIGDSIHEDSFVGKAKELIDKYATKGKLVLPRDIVIADGLNENASFRIVKASEPIPDGFQGVDIGPDTVELFAGYLRKAKTVFWNGPLGVFEVPQFAHGTDAIAHILGDVKARSIVGGGDSIAALQKACVLDKMAHVSTGGGASLEFIRTGDTARYRSIKN